MLGSFKVESCLRGLWQVSGYVRYRSRLWVR